MMGSKEVYVHDSLIQIRTLVMTDLLGKSLVLSNKY
jgi:hypothetical protein